MNKNAFHFIGDLNRIFTGISECYDIPSIFTHSSGIMEISLIEHCNEIQLLQVLCRFHRLHHFMEKNRFSFEAFTCFLKQFKNAFLGNLDLDSSIIF